MSDLEEQLQEFESIQSIYDSHKLSFDRNLITKLQSIIESNNTNTKHKDLKFTLSITDTILIDCTLPSTYPSKSSPNLFVRTTSSKFSKSSIEDANNLLKSRIDQEFDPGNPLLFDLFDWIQENIPSVITVANFSNNPSKSNKKRAMRKLNLQRTYMWFHHIYSTTKKRNINQLAKQYKLTGFCVTGKPGVIVAEGLDKNVNQYISDLKSWNWQRMIVRHSDNEIYDDNESFEKGMRFKKWTFNHIPPHTKGGMKDVYEYLKEADLEKYYKLIVHINTPMDCNLNDEENKEDGDKEKINDNGYEYEKYNKKKKGRKNGNGKDDKADIKKLGYLSEYKNGVLLTVNVKPNAKESCIVESADECLYLRIAAEARDGAANKELCRFIAKMFGCGKSEVVMHRGHKSRDKCVVIQNMSLKDVTVKILNAI